MTTATLIEMRREAADRKFQDFDFGSAQVEEMGGWEYEGNGDEMTRAVYFAPHDDPSADTQRGHFTVRFGDGSAAIEEAYGALGGAIFEDKVETSLPRP
jgi:hypothetical protein